VLSARHLHFAPIGLLLLSLCAHAADLPRIADIHLHWKWNQKEVTDASEAIKILREQNVGLAVVTGTPPELALELQELAPDIVRPIYGIYRVPGEWASWHHDKDLLKRVRQALESGRYFGIGEIHMIGGFISDWKNPVIASLFNLAAEFDVPVLLHTEFSRANYTLGLCQAHPQTRFLWAHAGSMLKPAEVERVLNNCPNVQVELSARDPWRHRGNPIADEQGQLLPGWLALVTGYADRFMIGSDPVWPVDRLNPWDEPDTGWQELPRFLDFHRTWLSALPEEEADAIRWENARRFFRLRDQSGR
jgi:predicted TIM-barrel fold metal-dependent hydrolase